MRIALTCNNYPPEFFGGTERVVQALARGITEAGDTVIVICGSDVPKSDQCVLRDTVDGVPVYRIPLDEDEGYGLSVTRLRLLELMRQVLCDEQIDVVHVHHWSHLSDGQIRMVRELGVGVIATLHDMWTSCGRFFRLPPQGIRCPPGDRREACVECANTDLRTDVAWIEDCLGLRDESISGELLAAHAVYAPSIDCAKACFAHTKVGPQMRERGIRVLPHGLLGSPPERRQKAGSDGIRVGTFGNLNREKGVLVLVRAMADVPTDLHLWGETKQDFVDEVDRLASQSGVRVIWHGAYDPIDAHPAVELDLAVFPSLCRETYGLVVEEALSAGTPVIVSDIGALPERIRGGGLILPPGDHQFLGAAIRRLVVDPEAFQELRATLPTHFHTISDSVESYREAYTEAIAAVRA